MSDLFTALDLLDLAIASSDGLASEAVREAAARAAASARSRREYLGDAILIAIAGGTGSGKSSLLNAIAGDDVASTSELRPHTDEPLAWIPAGDPVTAAFVAELGIGTVVEHEDAPELAVVDLPDLDSIDGRHRALVEGLIPVADAVIWLFDPVKYHDPSIHRDFLAGMTAYEPVFLFVLNKIDRLDDAEREAVAAHLTGILEVDGFTDPSVVSIAAAPPEGEPQGMESLRAAIDRRLVAVRADRLKLVEDIREAGRRLAADANVWNGTAEGTYDRIREAADDPEELAAVLTEARIEGPLREALEAAAPGDQIERLLLRRSEFAATVAALGVACSGLRQHDGGAFT